MSPDRSLLCATLLITIGATTALADPPHQGGSPTGLQIQLERGDPLLLAWRDREDRSGYRDDDDDDDDDDHDRYGYSDQGRYGYSDQERYGYDDQDRYGYGDQDRYGYGDQDRYGYSSAAPYDDRYATEPVEDTLSRIIQDVSDLTERLSR
jgi:hypothetical protein